MTIFFASSSSVGIPIARELLKEKLVDGFISNPNKPAGRNREIQPNPFAIWAETTNLKVHRPTNNLELKTIIENSELILTCSYGLLINGDLLTIPKLGWLNVHFSLLPKYRGAAPVQRAIQNGDSETGYSVFRMEEGLDTGNILYQEKFPIPPEIKASELLEKLSFSAASKITQLLSMKSTWTFKKQIGDVSLAPKIRKEENRINWSASAKSIFNNFRALDFNGGTHAFFRDEKIDVLEMSMSDFKLEGGKLMVQGNRLFVGAGTGSLEVTKIRPAGKKIMSVKDWLNGARINSGEKFE